MVFKLWFTWCGTIRGRGMNKEIINCLICEISRSGSPTPTYIYFEFKFDFGDLVYVGVGDYRPCIMQIREKDVILFSKD